MIFREERYEKLIKQIENKLKKINVITDDFDNLTDEQENELELIGKKITKVIEQVWEDTNYDLAKKTMGNGSCKIRIIWCNSIFRIERMVYEM